MKQRTIHYILTCKDGSRQTFDFIINISSMELVGNIPNRLPSWTRLDYHQCPNCPLDVLEHPYCPAAANLVSIVNSFESIPSYEEIHVEVITDERIISQDTTAQTGISSMMGFVMATSGCPRTAFLKPMARFHLVLANEEETIYRAASMYLLAQYFLNKEGLKIDLELKGLADLYKNVHIVNNSIAQRLQAASQEDSSVNALVLLDVRAWELQFEIEDSLEKIRYLFALYLPPVSS